MLKERQEKFCQHFIKTRNAAESARVAGYSHSGADRAGCRLLKKPEIKARVAELDKIAKQVSNKQFGYDCGTLVKKFEAAYEKSMAEDGGGMAACKNMEAIAKLTGHWVEKHQVLQDPITISMVIAPPAPKILPPGTIKVLPPGTKTEPESNV